MLDVTSLGIETMAMPVFELSMAAGLALSTFACGAHDEMVKVLNGKYNEQRTATAVSGQAFIEFFENQTSGTFTVLGTMPNGPTCIVIAGEGKNAAPQASKMEPNL